MSLIQWQWGVARAGMNDALGVWISLQIELRRTIQLVSARRGRYAKAMLKFASFACG